MKLTCACGAVNRLPRVPTARIRCGKCKHEFTPRELGKARPEDPTEFQLQREDDTHIFDDEEDVDPDECPGYKDDPTDPGYCRRCGDAKEDHK